MLRRKPKIIRKLKPQFQSTDESDANLSNSLPNSIEAQELRKKMMRIKRHVDQQNRNFEKELEKSRPVPDSPKILANFRNKSHKLSQPMAKLALDATAISTSIQLANKMLSEDIDSGNGLNIDMSIAQNIVTKLFKIKITTLMLDALDLPEHEKEMIINNTINATFPVANKLNNQDNDIKKTLQEYINKLPKESPYGRFGRNGKHQEAKKG